MLLATEYLIDKALGEWLAARHGVRVFEHERKNGLEWEVVQHTPIWLISDISCSTLVICLPLRVRQVEVAVGDSTLQLNTSSKQRV
jgi:3-deoxy-D-arabino-heptulosonate 7-phosphate (DAHP) synthase